MARGGEPSVRVEPVSFRRKDAGEAPGRWLGTWRVENVGAAPLRIDAAWLPHGRFRGEERRFAAPPTVAPGEGVELELAVRCAEPPGTVVENAFLILRAFWQGREWRVLARMLVTIDAQGAPSAAVEAVTMHPVGFSRRGVESKGGKERGDEPE